MNSLSAYVPCFNNQHSVGRTLISLRRQLPAIDDLFLVDDASVDASVAVATQLGVSVVVMPRNLGRGAVRAIAIEKAQSEFLLSCDATNFLPADFSAQAMRWFADANVGAVFGRICQECPSSLADRWRGRHLFKEKAEMTVQHRALLSTYGCILRRSAVLQVGNFNPNLRHSEDADLGRRLLDEGFDVIFDPDLLVICSVSNTMLQVLERYWRWYAGAEEEVNPRVYLKQIWFSIKVMAIQDLQDGDVLAALVSLFSPHYQFWKSLAGKLCLGSHF